MNVKKVLFAGVVVGILSGIWGGITCGWLFNWVYSLEPTTIWRGKEAMTAGFTAMVNIANIVFSTLLAFVYALLYKGIPGKGVIKGLWYGVVVWLVGTLPGSFMAGVFSVIAKGVIVYWIISGLITNIWQGVVISLIYKEGSE
ncbi:MAG: hypothetical protein QMD92_06950 [bacterium]|nr:hypothetical protein [bacterium]